MFDRRKKSAEIFRDTERLYTSDDMLKQVVQKSTEFQCFISDADHIVVPAAYKTKKARVAVSGKRSLEAAEVYAKQGKKV